MKKIFMVITLAAVVFVQAEEIGKLNTAEAWKSDPAFSCKDGVFTVKGKAQLQTTETFTVDPEKTYKITVSARSVSTPGTTVMPVIMQYDRNGRLISTGSVDVIGGTYTKLLAPVKRGDKSLLVENAALWIRKRLLVIAFNAKDDYSDLPNHALAWNTITGIEESNGACRVILAQPIQFAVKPGAVRLHNNGSALMYPLGGRSLNDKWLTLSGKISGMERKRFSHNKWAPGAVSARLGFQINFNKPDGVVEIKDISIIAE